MKQADYLDLMERCFYLGLSWRFILLGASEGLATGYARRFTRRMEALDRERERFVSCSLAKGRA